MCALARCFLLTGACFIFYFDRITSHRQKNGAPGGSPDAPGLTCLGCCLRPLLLGGSPRLHRCCHFCRRLFAWSLAVGTNVVKILFAVGLNGGAAPLLSAVFAFEKVVQPFCRLVLIRRCSSNYMDWLLLLFIDVVGCIWYYNKDFLTLAAEL